MKGFLAVAALVGAVVASPMPQATAPAGCSLTEAGTFEITTVNVTKSSKRDLVNRQADGTLVLTLTAGVLKDSSNRTGYIAANRQFQFDNPIQAGAVITSGWSVCSNGSLSLSGSSIFYQCLSGTFYNLYDKSQGAQCNAIYIVASTASSSTAAASGTATTKVTQLSDGQPQATSAKVSQISDGQPQATTGTAKVSQISDGQIQATTAAPGSTASAAKVSQISDGQIQATTSAAKVSQISDGQIQAPTSTSSAAKVSQISDGQIQAGTSTSSAAKVSQISDGQIQAPTSTSAIATFTGAARREAAGGFAFVAGIVGAVALL